MTVRFACVAWLIVAATPAIAQIEPPPSASPPGILRIWANARMATVIESWARGFRQDRPDVRIEVMLAGSDVAIAGLYTGKADIALMGREAAEMEAKAFEWIHRYPPSRVAVMTGSARAAGESPALAILIHRDNPLTEISLDQLRDIFGHGERRLATWRALGLKGGWCDRPIALYGPESESGTGRFFRHKVLADSNKLAWDRLTEFPEPVKKGVQPDTAPSAIARALADDPAGMAIGVLPGPDAPVKAIALVGDTGPAIPLTVETVRDHRYPLTRTVYAYVNKVPGKALDEETAAFLAFVHSQTGQAIAEQEGNYLPLHPAIAAGEARAPQ
ncbi:hypothetical protein D1610_06930 [Sphingomonas gilva]|uniref:PBP domain-containing protein n=1 Tax=Sphingomonas gilva TaxID=2305907 RepID=A0A396RP41_9SPHN|nr:substrate-binding domain-containing protein [Sphingomonas gilva]RHW18208.1 hypothetical protein D1610_06930 [Sphingomonas gilva]